MRPQILDKRGDVIIFETSLWTIYKLVVLNYLTSQSRIKNVITL